MSAASGAGITAASPPGGAGAGKVAGSEFRRGGLLAALGRTVRELRGGMGLSQGALAKRAGLSPRFIAQLESGRGNISVAKLAELSRALEVSLPALLAFSTPPLAAGDPSATLVMEINARLRGLPPADLVQLLASLEGGSREVAPGSFPVIALVGLRGAGKSTLGPLLARALNRPFLELDEEIQDQTGLATPEIFELHGEEYYRQAETGALERLVGREEPVVVAISGGAVTDPALFRLLRERTLLIWVQADPEKHMARVIFQGDRRPMANRPNAMAELRRLLKSRERFYRQARFTANTSSASPEDCARELAQRIAGP